MSLLVVSQADVVLLLPMNECIAVMRDVFVALARGDAVLPLRSMMALPDQRGVLALMPAYMTSTDTLAVKVITVLPSNLDTPFDSHQGAVLLFDSEDGRLMALLDASEITAIRTAATSALATALLAREDAHDLAILGSGVEARSHLNAMTTVRDVSRIRVWSRRSERAAAFAARESSQHGRNIAVCSNAEAAVRGADLICTTTAAPDPVLQGSWISPGAHINAVGAHTAATRELDTEAVVNSSLFVDNRESAFHEAGDFLIPKGEGAVTDKHIVGDLGDLLLNESPGRKSDDEITLFKSLGVAVQDVAAARHVYRRAIELGMGTQIEFGGLRNPPAS
ncbi:MAG: ornithine cyclodeaminase family protein [Gemmatimonadales bacterium]